MSVARQASRRGLHFTSRKTARAAIPQRPKKVGDVERCSAAICALSRKTPIPARRRHSNPPGPVRHSSCEMITAAASACATRVMSRSLGPARPPPRSPTCPLASTRTAHEICVGPASRFTGESSADPCAPGANRDSNSSTSSTGRRHYRRRVSHTRGGIALRRIGRIAANIHPRGERAATHGRCYPSAQKWEGAATILSPITSVFIWYFRSHII